MTLIRWSPTPLSTLRDLTVHDEFNRLVDNFFTRGTSPGDLHPVFTPAVDIEETPEAFVVRMDLPGVSQKDVKVSLMGDTLTIRGERKQESRTQDGSRHRIERVHGTFERSFVLDAPVRNDQVKAQVKDGVLEVRVPKAEEARLREVEVQVA